MFFYGETIMIRGDMEIVFRFFIPLLVSALLCVCGCSREDKVPPGSVVIKLWTASNPDEMAWAEELLREWRVVNPHIIVRAQPVPESKSSEEILMASVIAGTTPDIYANLSPVIVEQLRNAKALECIDEYPELLNSLKERVPEEPMRGFVSPDGYLYQVPWKCNPVMMFCNVEKLDAMGAKPPRTYSEWLNLASRIRKSMPGVYMTQFDISTIWHKHLFDFYPLYIAASSGQTLMDGKINVDNEYSLQVMSFLRQNFIEEYVPMEFIPGNAFGDEKVLFYISGPWNVPFLNRERPELKYDVFPVPVPDGYDFGKPVHTFADPKCIGIFRTTKYKAECAQFVQFMCSRRIDAMFVKKCQQLVYRKDLHSDEMFCETFKKYPVLKKFAEAVPYTRSVDLTPRLMELLDALSIEYVDVVVRGIRTPEEGLKRAQKRMEEIEK